ncbi:hypothetical protein [Silvanigrella aquatica]|uniref:Beta-lactamase-related domain-containing protein n=1 Tax=Silvanigrella aquatica TaxID=1915309 RepID=A0A1L4D3S8_9BACT|nr:hypothetical protein [Silvanigrella aquatica]APJ04839.1 hypothetical protein AXG55_13400 [Silvanigrella aquatica]
MNLSIQKYLQSHIAKNFFECFEELELKMQNGNFTSWSFANKEGCLSSFWADECFLNKTALSDDSGYLLHPNFDLSSITKPLFLNLYFRILFKNEFVDIINTPINEYAVNKIINDSNDELIHFIMNNKVNYTLNSFLSHTSGVKRWSWMGKGFWSHLTTSHHKDPNILHHHVDLSNKNASEIIKRNLNLLSIKAFQEDMFDQTIYSDINYFILARIAESFYLNDKKWDGVINLLNEKLNTNFFYSGLSPEKNKMSVPYYPYISNYNDLNNNLETTKDNFYGFVHDTNANILSSLGSSKNIISGHAGFFGNVTDVMKAMPTLIQTQYEYLKLNKNYSNKRFIYGLDTPTTQESTAGLHDWDKYQMNVFGHLGYSGTSFWFLKDENDARGHFHILLTNRTSQRQKYGVEKCPRIYIYSDFNSKSTKFFQSIGDAVCEITKTEAFETISEYYGMSKKIWDQSVIRTPPNINDVRRFTGNKLWNI